MTKKLRWGLLGTAKINRKVIAPMQKSKRHLLAAVASRDSQKAQAYADTHHIPSAYGSYEAMLADPNIDVIYNSLPNHLHAEWTIKACQAGKHVLCEKPLAITLNEVDAMQTAAGKAGVILQEAFMYRHHPQTLMVKEMLDQGILGRINLIRGIFTFLLTEPENVRLKPEMGGGSLWDVGVYPISYFRSMLGLEPQRVFGMQVNAQSGIDLSFSGELTFPDQILGQFQCGFNAAQHTSIEIMGEKGSLTIPNPFSPYKGEDVTLKSEGKTKKIKVKGMNLYLGELDNMADCILKSGNVRVTLEDSRKNTRVVLALLESARTGQIIPID